MEQLLMILQDGAEVFFGSDMQVERQVEASELVMARLGSGDDGQRPEETIGGPRLDSRREGGGGYVELEG
ncbi:hypothetical protein ACFX13_031017 [Malus domestica]